MQAYVLLHSLIFEHDFSVGRTAGAADPGGPEIIHDQQQSHIVLLAPH